MFSDGKTGKAQQEKSHVCSNDVSCVCEREATSISGSVGNLKGEDTHPFPNPAVCSCGDRLGVLCTSHALGYHGDS